MARKIAYILSRFPKISETFILREINALQNEGWKIKLYPLILEKEKVVHAEAEPWLKTLHHFPWVSRDIIRANLRFLFKSPFSYLKLWGRMVLGNGSNPKFLARALIIFPKALRMAEEMQKSGIQHIHAHYATHPALTAWLIHNLTGISYSVTVHAHDIYVSQTMLAEKMHSASFIIAISEFNREFLIKHVGTEVEEKIKVVHCGIDLNTYKSREETPPHAKFQLKSIGSLEDYKGMRYLIEACALLVERKIPLHCEIIGRGKKRHQLETLIQKYRLEEMVFLAGAKTQKEVAEALSNADCYVQPSIITETGKMEGIPVAIMEALGSELPVVASGISGISELVRPEETGYLVPEKKPKILASTLAYVFQHPQKSKHLAEKGRKLVEEEYDLSKNSARVARLFEEFLNQ